jgi:hypothetical protein
LLNTQVAELGRTFQDQDRLEHTHPLHFISQWFHEKTAISRADVFEAGTRVCTPNGLEAWQKHGPKPGDWNRPPIKQFRSLEWLYPRFR